MMYCIAAGGCFPGGKERCTMTGKTVGGPKILLVDDVFTTGATSNECAKVLKRAQSSKIFVLTFATGRFHAELY